MKQQKTFIKAFTLLLLIALSLQGWGQGTEDFTNLPTASASSYLARSWTGTDGVTWTAVGARTDQTINGKAICWGNSGTRNVISPTYTGGMGTLSFKYVRAFTGTSARSLEVWVNNVQIGSTITVSPTSNDVVIYSEVINVSGNVVLEIRSTGAAQVILDDISWTAYSSSCTTPTYSFADASVNKTLADVPFTNALTSQNTSTKVWSSSNETVATVDANGEVTILTAGTTNIQVTQIEDATYCAVSTSYPLTVTGPTIEVSTTELSGFTYLHGSGPSAEQNFTVSGTNLTNDVVITPPSNYEISTGTGGSFVATNPINLPHTSGTLAPTTIYVRLKATLAVGTYNETINLTSTNATPKTVNVSGSVTTDQAPNVIITEVYGAGGNSGAILKNDFIELYNTTNSPINIGGWSVQYYSATGTAANVTTIPAGTIIPAKSHFLIQQAGGANGSELYQPDLTGSIAMAAASGKVILFTFNTAVTTTSDINSIIGHSNFKDYVPYGASTPVWGSAVGTISTTTSATRKMVAGEYVYTQNIGNDFEVVTPTPQNTGKYRSVASGDWNNLATWEFTDNGTWNPSAIIPSSITSSVIVLSGHEITITDDATVNELNVNPTGKLSLNDTKTLIAKNIILESDITGTATLVDKNINGGVTVQENAKIQQYLTGTGGLNTPTGRGWYIASPVAGATSATFIPTATDKIWSHSEANQVSTGNGYTEILNNSTLLTPGSGYVVRLGANATVTFEGTSFETGVINYTNLSRTGTTNAKRGFHLMGNPYPSYLDWENATKTNIESTKWYRASNSGGAMVFDTYNAANQQGTNNNQSGAVNRHIPPMQAFWVKVTTDGQTGSLGFTNAMRSHQSGNLLKTTNQSEVLRLNISNGINSDEAIILFNQSAGTGLTSWDSEKMMNESVEIPQLFTKEGSTNLVINSLPEITNGLTVPMYINIGQSGQYSINPDISELDPFTVVTLQDLQLGLFHDLSNGAYNFTSTVVNNSNRFVLHFNTVLTDGNLTINNTTIYTADNKLHINSAEAGILEVYDLLGKRIIKAELNSGMNVISLSSKGVYLVRVSNSKEVITEKVSLW